MDEGLQQLLLVLLGGLLATLSPGIVDAIARKKRRVEFRQVVSTELHELRFLLALILIRVHGKLHTMNQEAVDLIRPILLEYKGHADDVALLDATKKLLGKGDASFIALHNAPAGSVTGLWPLPYHAPYLDGHLNELALLPVEMQRSLLRVLAEVSLFNEQVAFVQKATDRTFDSSLSRENYLANDANLKSGTEKLATRASELIRAINRVLDRQGNPLK
ncbi:MAG TPA: hypothetical protein VN908_06340 [Gemmatimonadales bacterium]|nr:hypothetical protein [Gemmatimonadales bacterium]